MTSNLILDCGEEELSARDLARLRKLEFVHNIGLIPVLRMNGGGNRDAAEGKKNVSGSAGNGSDGRGRGQKRGFDKVEPEVSTSDTTEPEDSNDDNDDDGEDGSSSTATTIDTFVGSGNGGQQVHDSDLEEDKSKSPPIPVPRKTYQDLLEENEQMKKQLQANTTEITDLKRLHDVITDENNLLTLELQEVQKAAKEEKFRLEIDLQENIKAKNILYRRVEKLKQGIREMNEILLDLINKIKKGQNSESTPSSSPTSGILLPRSPMSPGDSPSSCTSSELQLALQKWVHPSLRQHSNSEQISPPTTSAPANHHSTSSKPTNMHTTPTSSSPRRSRRPSSIAKQVSRCLECIPPYFPELIRKITQESSKTKKSDNKLSGSSQIKPKPESCKKASPTTKKLLHAVDENRQHEGFYCICGTSVTSRLGLITHIKYHTYEGQFCCSVKGCGRRYFTTSCLRTHMKAKHGLAYNGRDGCRRCGQTFLSRMQLYLHCKTVHKCGPLLAHRKCPDSADTTFSSSSPAEPVTLKSKSTVSVSTEKKKIPIDNKHKGGPFRNNFMHQIHHELDSSKSHEENQEYVCVCGREFTTKHNLRMHIKYFTYEPRFKCKLCGKRYNGTNLLRQHMKTRHGVTYSGYGCRSCGKVFKTMATLYQHCRVTHNTGPFGNTNFQKRSLIVQSVQKAATSVVVTGAMGDTPSKRQRKVPSKYIEESETNVSPSNRSNRIISKLKSKHPVHADDSNSTNGIKCTCGTAFTTSQALLNHIKLRTSQNIYKCLFCPCKFPRRDYLRNHVSLAHYTTTKIPYSGSSGKGSRSGNITSFRKRSPGQVNGNVKKNLTSPRHGVARSDVEKKLFICLCGLECVRRESLREHIRLKLGLTQFKCEICDAMFWRHDYLKGHLQKVHDLLMSGYACRVCGKVGFDSSNAVKKHHAVFHNKENGTEDPLLALPSEG